jgi:hypothetical protein
VAKKALGDRRMELVEEVKELLVEMAKTLKGCARRLSERPVVEDAYEADEP